ncbi:hypothetical protein V5O48_002766 [Marasmius crinis-equi]|uniref:BTB domain-containing protein n=1 Tax=Marasmius crinis-equi TaxID=585013 RepID=A0ABR3FVW1_9AGAR
MELVTPSNSGGSGGNMISISSAFGPATSLSTSRPPVNLILLTSDSVVFYVDEATLLQASSNSFKSLLPITAENQMQRILFMEDIPSAELEYMLQAIYNVRGNTVSAAANIQTLMRAVDRLPVYGISPGTCISPTSHLYQYLLSSAPLHPMEIYALAAQYGMETLAVTVSSHTLVLELSQISEDLSARMGSMYLLRLFQLHTGRTDTLKRLLAAELELHYVTDICNFDKQKRLKEGWNLAVASLSFNLRPDTTTTTIRNTILEHTSDLTCPDCIKLRETHLNKVISEWVVARRTITI